MYSILRLGGFEMRERQRKIFKFSFSSICIVAAAFMVGYWFYKFKVEDREVGVVDYVTLEKADDVHFPTVSMCLENPFLEDKLNNICPNTNISTYLKFLRGELYDENLQQISYDNVTIDLNNYFLFGEGQLLNETNYHKSSSENKHIFSGFYHGKFVKCFAVTMRDKSSHSM